ncbi:MAG: formyltetrahydrofolate deformylase [Gammaproteobacteria bacterium]
MNQKTSYILKINCPDKVGIVAEVAGFLRDAQCFIEESAHFGDRDTCEFFMRTLFTPENGFSRESFESGFNAISDRLDMCWELHDTSTKPRVLVLVSKTEHCLNDLLYRHRIGDLNIDIPAIMSNHTALEHLAEWHNIPFHHVPVNGENHRAAEKQLVELTDKYSIDLVVLARYMQILSDELCTAMSGRIINIHHSFLPGFKGARPYHQAHARGVKLIGATAHYATPELDEGPIIEQMVERVDHSYTPERMTAVGRDVEAITLARALKFHAEHRVFLNGKRTVVFRH